MAQEEKVFADGFSFKRRDNAPEFVVGRVSIKCDEAVAFMRKNHKNGWVNLNINQAKSGNYYVELDTFEPKSKNENVVKETKEEGVGINVVNGEYVNMVEEGIIDPVLVTKTALKNAVSVVTTIISADCVISNIRVNESS